MIHTFLRQLTNTKIVTLAVIIVFLVVFIITSPVSVYAASAQEDICRAAGNSWTPDASGTGGTCTASGVTVNGALTTTINVLSFIVGVASVIMIIVGGFRYVTSGGDANAAKSARGTILYAVVGLVVVLVSQAIVQFVLGSAT